MYYVATVLLRMDEETFWRCTPRKLFALMDCHVEANTTQEYRQENNIKGRKKVNTERNNKEVITSIASW